MFKSLELSSDLTIFTSTISNIDNKSLAKDLEYNCEVAIDTKTGDDIPGIQSRIKITSKNISIIKNEILKQIISFLELNDDYIIAYQDWTFISDNTNKNSNYHSHIEQGNLNWTKEKPVWTFIYYVEMPNNLSGDEGKLLFKTKTKEVSILPIENQIILFKADVLHRPLLNPNSTNKRVVYAANISVLDRSKKYTKSTQTLL